MRRVFILVAVAAFIGLGLYDAVHGHPTTGVASLLLAIVNLLLLGGAS